MRQGNFNQIESYYNFNYKLPNPNFNKKLVFGKVMSLFTVKDPHKFSTAIEAAAGGKLNNVVVMNERVSKELIHEKCLYYNVTFIPLNMIKGENLQPDIITRMKELTSGRARPAKELIDYDPQYEAAMNFVFGNVVSQYQFPFRNLITFIVCCRR